MSAWKKLHEHLRTLSEGIKYRGKSDVTLKDLQKLGDEIGVHIDPNGGMARTEHKFKPGIWTGWQDQPGPALAVAATDSARLVQTGNPQGGTIHKTNWKGQVQNIPAPIRPHANDRLGSTMDRYDILMVGDPDIGVLTKIAWSPSMGSFEERSERLKALISGGQAPALRRRPQGVRPDVKPTDVSPDQLRGAAQARQNKMKAAADAEDKENERRAKLGLPPMSDDELDSFLAKRG